MVRPTGVPLFEQSGRSVTLTIHHLWGGRSHLQPHQRLTAMVPSGPPSECEVQHEWRPWMCFWPCEFLDPPRRLRNKHGDGSGVPARLKKQPRLSLLGEEPQTLTSICNVLSWCEGDVRRSVASDHVVAKHIWTVNTQHELRPWGKKRQRDLLTKQGVTWKSVSLSSHIQTGWCSWTSPPEGSSRRAFEKPVCLYRWSEWCLPPAPRKRDNV